MIRSMTGFGKVERNLQTGVLSVEVRSVNSRYFDFSIRFPEIFECLEEDIKRLFTTRLERGRIKVFITLNGNGAEKPALKVNRSRVEHYRNLLNETRELIGSEESLTLAQMLNFDDIFDVQSGNHDEDYLQSELYEVINETIDQVLEMQTAEGAHLAADIQSHLDIIIDLSSKIQSLSAGNKGVYVKKMKGRLQELAADLDIDENRLLQEAALYSKKIDITEECERLTSHVRQFRNYFEATEPVGKRMTFLIQEMNREISTIGAKSEDATVSHYVVEIKNELEKIREQAQNIL